MATLASGLPQGTMAQPTDFIPLPSEVSGANGRQNIFEMWMGPWAHLTRQSTIYAYTTPRLEARKPQLMEDMALCIKTIGKSG